MAYTQYRIPPREAADTDILGWLKEGVQDSAAYLAQQRPAEDLKIAFDIISGKDSDRVPAGQSDVRSNRMKRQAREIVGTLADLNPLWQYGTDNSEYTPQGIVLNKCAMAWWHNTHAARGIRSALQYAVVAGTGWILPTYKRDYWTVGRGDIVLDTGGPMSVLPIQIPENGDYQRAYSVTIRHEMPIAMAHATYPLLQNLIVPDRDAPSMLSDFGKRMDKFLSPVLNIFGQGAKRQQALTKFPTVDIYHTYTLDMSINETGRTISMGTPGTTWEYEVPTYGSDVYVGNDGSGNAMYRKATFEDAMIYPLRRLTVWTNTCKVSDDTSPWWHGKVPAIKLTTDDWPWEILGFSLLRDGEKLDRARNDLMRDVQDNSRVRMRPPLKYDPKAVSKSDMEKLNTRVPNVKLGVDQTMGGNVEPLIPWEYYQIPQEVPAMIELYANEEDYLLGIKDMTAFAKARAMPAGDYQQIEEFAGPLVKDISGGMECSIAELGQMLKPMFFQFYNLPRRMQILGENGIVKEDFDYKPGMMVPSHMPGEPTNTESRYKQYQRARMFANNFYFQVTPGTLHQITQMSQKLLFLQLQRAGFPLDPWTMAEVMQIPNFGPAPKGATTVMERVVAWERMKMEQAAEAQKMMAQIQEAGVEANAAAETSGKVRGAMGSMGIGTPPKRNPGRQPTGQVPPHIVQKDGGSRSTIAES